jgi:predicted nucleic acid-binding protein
VEWFLLSPRGLRVDQRIARRRESLHCPHLFDLEVTQVFRRLAREGIIPANRADAAIQDLLRLNIDRYEHLPLLPQIWHYRHNLTPYDAAYVTLAEKLGAILITCDRRMMSAPGHRARIEVF